MLLFNNVIPEQWASFWKIKDTNDIADENQDTYVVDELVQKAFYDVDFSLPDAITLYNHIFEEDTENRGYRAVDELVKIPIKNEANFIMIINFIRSIKSKNTNTLKYDWETPSFTTRRIKELKEMFPELFEENSNWFTLLDLEKRLQQEQQKEETKKKIQELSTEK